MNAAGAWSAAGASDGAAAPAITPKATVKDLTNRGKAVPATRSTARARGATRDDRSRSSGRWIRSEFLVRLSLMPFLPRMEDCGRAHQRARCMWECWSRRIDPWVAQLEDLDEASRPRSPSKRSSAANLALPEQTWIGLMHPSARLLRFARDDSTFSRSLRVYHRPAADPRWMKPTGRPAAAL
jgi:hypothetical protein